MKNICCYILWSEKLQKFYTGACQDSLEERILKHNTGHYSGNNYTKNATDWCLFLKIEAYDFSHAIRMERKIKAMKSSVYIRNLMKYKELQDKLRGI